MHAFTPRPSNMAPSHREAGMIVKVGVTVCRGGKVAAARPIAESASSAVKSAYQMQKDSRAVFKNCLAVFLALRLEKRCDGMVTTAGSTAFLQVGGGVLIQFFSFYRA